MAIQDDPSLVQRISRLERRNRYLTWLVLSLPTVGLLLGAASQDIWRGKRVVAEEFVLSDADGKTRASLTLGKDGAHLLLLGADGKTKVNVAADNEGFGPGIFLYGDNGEQPVVALRFFRKDNPYWSGKGPYLALDAEPGKRVLHAFQSPETGVGGVGWYDREGKQKGAVGFGSP